MSACYFVTSANVLIVIEIIQIKQKQKMTDGTGSYIHVEQTLALIKPDAIEKADEIEEMILQHGFAILQRRRVQLTPEQTSEFYSEHYGMFLLLRFCFLFPFLEILRINALYENLRNSSEHLRKYLSENVGKSSWL